MKLWTISLILGASALVAGPAGAVGHTSSVATQIELRGPGLPLAGATRPPPAAVWIVIFGVVVGGFPALSPIVRPAPRSRERRSGGAFRPLTRRTS